MHIRASASQQAEQFCQWGDAQYMKCSFSSNLSHLKSVGLHFWQVCSAAAAAALSSRHPINNTEMWWISLPPVSGFSQEEGQNSLSCGLSQRICGVRWMLCAPDARGSNLSQPLFRAQAFFLSNPTTLCIHSRQSCEERMFPPTQTSRQAAAPGSSSPPTVMLWNAVYGKPSLTAWKQPRLEAGGSILKLSSSIDLLLSFWL